ncbi:flagellar basal body rod protein FlgC [Fictibacillus macauensis ZFHKF-1]|uniref:Flagellar basal-body rod protein FlgC n=1 Tax=Fictibacillus macauensis ZFHKF-1 TaxID=1196324 RepID=I8UE50_9BACL|nr:flagellar basal body rod protein FlgC [Fictibacillus macauensis]EIT85078.1 flagellar basal body rod protein FlgC [Fictibacillus macauensis ZFHKF-1]
MGIFNALNSSASALTAQRLKMDVVSSNMANAETTRGTRVNGKWIPYQRKMVVAEASNRPFASFYEQATAGAINHEGVVVRGIVNDRTPFKRVYNPTHPDANEQGYVLMPNVDPLKEMIDLMSASRSYEANVTALNASKAMYAKALEIGR